MLKNIFKHFVNLWYIMYTEVSVFSVSAVLITISKKSRVFLFIWTLLISSSGLSSKTVIIIKGKGSFYIAQYPVRWTAQSASHFAFPDRPVHSDTVLGFSGKHSSQAAIMRQD